MQLAGKVFWNKSEDRQRDRDTETQKDRQTT